MIPDYAGREPRSSNAALRLIVPGNAGLSASDRRIRPISSPFSPGKNSSSSLRQLDHHGHQRVQVDIGEVIHPTFPSFY